MKHRRPVVVNLREMYGKQPPHAPEAEMSLLGSMILDPVCIGDVTELLASVEDFYAEKHQHIYRALVDVYDATDGGDLTRLITLLTDRKVADDVGGPEYLSELASATPTAANAMHYARIVREKARLRRLIVAAGEATYAAYNADSVIDGEVDAILDAAESSVSAVAQAKGTSEPEDMGSSLDAIVTRLEADEQVAAGVTTGFAALDAMIYGLHPTELSIIAGRPSMGKTALGMNIAERVARTGLPVGVFSLEMSRKSVVERVLSSAARVPSSVFRGREQVPDEVLRRVYFVADEVKGLPIHIDDTPGLSIMGLRTKARRMARKHKIGLLVVDYLQLMTAPGASKENRQVEVSAISRGLKGIARELNVPVVCLAQLNRAAEQREGNRPRMADLRESGSIEQDADVVMLLHREEYYRLQDPNWAAENPDKVGVAEVIVAKHRNGPTGVVRLRWDATCTRFDDDEFPVTQTGNTGTAAYSPWAPEEVPV